MAAGYNGSGEYTMGPRVMHRGSLRVVGAGGDGEKRREDGRGSGGGLVAPNDGRLPVHARTVEAL